MAYRRDPLVTNGLYTLDNSVPGGLYHETVSFYIPKPKFVYLGPSCSKLTTSLVNVSLKFQTLILQIHCHFLLKKCENPLHCKGFSHFFIKK